MASAAPSNAASSTVVLDPAILHANVTRVLVSGATGYIAGHVVANLLEHGLKVRGTVRNVANTKKYAHLTALPGASERLEIVQADLTDADSWVAACKGISHVMHVASPAPARVPKDDDELVKPAVEGTRNVLAAAKAAGVRRVVVTSSNSAISAGWDAKAASGYEFTEDDWSNWKDAGPMRAYCKSKTLAERAAYEYGDDDGMRVMAVNPVLVLGPLLSDTVGSSLMTVHRLINRGMPGVPDLHWNIVDVRDVAEAHYRAAFLPDIPTGTRFILSAGERSFVELAKLLSRHYADKGYAVPTMRLPNPLVKLIALVDAPVAIIAGNLSKTKKLSNKRAATVLGIKFREPEESVLACAQSMIDRGVANKSSDPTLKIALVGAVAIAAIALGAKAYFS